MRELFIRVVRFVPVFVSLFTVVVRVVASDPEETDMLYEDPLVKQARGLAQEILRFMSGVGEAVRLAFKLKTDNVVKIF